MELQNTKKEICSLCVAGSLEKNPKPCGVNNRVQFNWKWAVQAEDQLRSKGVLWGLKNFKELL